MHHDADYYVSNPSVDYDVHKIIFAGKERSAESISIIKIHGIHIYLMILKKIIKLQI